MSRHHAGDVSDSHACEAGARLLSCLRDDDVDAAIEAGLMRFAPCPACDPELAGCLDAAKQRLSAAWAARDRYRLRHQRLLQRAAAREAGRTVQTAEKKSALPAAAAAVLAQAKAKAAEREGR